ncbi:hypothetical protein VNI00_017756 [Paramarasmius palmivorus]|uniref:Uncharacterized protein n=1 Tax=Paramarasmius palmivorus TaxID=297713 RepID=A0AAW0B3N0_9AGAR
MSNFEDDSDSDTPHGWNISKLCEAANHLRLAPEYTPYVCEPEILDEILVPLPLYETEHPWYLLLTVGGVGGDVRPGIYRDIRSIKSQIPKETPSNAGWIIRGADTLEEAHHIWQKQCVKYHRELPSHQHGQEALDDHAYSVASIAKAHVVHQELLAAYPRFRPRRRRRIEHLSPQDNGSISAGPSHTMSTQASSTVATVNADNPGADGWNIYVVHTLGHRRHRNLEYALAALHSHGTAPARMVLARSSERARRIFEIETGTRDASVNAT